MNHGNFRIGLASKGKQNEYGNKGLEGSLKAICSEKRCCERQNRQSGAVSLPRFQRQEENCSSTFFSLTHCSFSSAKVTDVSRVTMVQESGEAGSAAPSSPYTATTREKTTRPLARNAEGRWGKERGRERWDVKRTRERGKDCKRRPAG